MNDNHNQHLDNKYAKYRAPGPYPEVKVTKPNLVYAELLMDDYAGVVSEFTAINQYLYHHYFFEVVDEELGELLEGVAINEMYHLEILAEIIMLLGGDPRYRGGESTQGRYWSGGYVQYGNTLCEQLDLDIIAEKDAIKNYVTHIQQIDDPHIKDILRRIIQDEEVHIRLFREQKKRFKCK